MIKDIKNIAFKEIQTQMDSISGYLLILLVLGFTYFLFLQTFFINSVATLRDLFSFLTWSFTIFIPALTMGTIARERDQQTIEYILTRPIKNSAIVIGKLVGNTVLAYTPILLTLPLVVYVGRIGSLDYGETFASYIAAFILATAMCSVGIAISSFFKSQIVSFLLSTILFFILNIIGSQFFAINLPSSITQFLSRLSITDNYLSMVRGVIDLQSLSYFIILISVGITLSIINLETIRRNKFIYVITKATSKLIILTALIVSLILTSEFIRYRLDLTSSKKYTLSQTTREIIKKDNVIKIDVYASSNLPPQFSSNYQELRNTLNDYDFQGGSNIEVQYLDASSHKSALTSLGIEPIRFNVVSQDQFEAIDGYLAVVISDKDVTRQEMIPFVSDINNLEYQITNAITKVIQEEKPQIALLEGYGAVGSTYLQLTESLSEYFEVVDVPLQSTTEEQDDQDTKTEEIQSEIQLQDYKTVIIPDPSDDYPDNIQNKILDYYNNGGNIIFFATGTTPNQATFQATKKENNTPDLFTDLGVTVERNIVFDTRSNGLVTLQSGPFSYVVQYPYFVKALKTNQASNNLPNSIVMMWPSSLSIKENEDWDVLYTSSQYGVIKDDENVNIGVEDQSIFNATQEELSTVPLVAAKNNDSGGSLIVIASSDSFTDQGVSRFPENLVLIQNLLEDLSGQFNLSSIRSKTIDSSRFSVVEDQDRFNMRIVAPLLSIFILVVIGFVRVRRNRNIVKRYRR